VPLPTSANDHQRRNAQALAAEGRALILEQTLDLPARLEAALLPLLLEPAARQALARAPEPNRAVELCLEDLASCLG
jgi:UDP-N-acetylglucosamine:LPS N-acetylglucosamine transferase